MARWRLINAHYLNVPDTTWEYAEADRTTGRNVKKTFIVPRYLDPADPIDQTPRNSGEVIVCYENKGQRHDHVFIGEPTPEMEPLDEEAEAVTAKCRPKWQHPIEGLPSNGDYSQSLIATFERMMQQLPQAAQAPNISVKGISLDDFTKLQEQMAALMAKNAELEATVAEVKVARRA